MVVRTEKINVLTLEDFVSPNMGFVVTPLSNFYPDYCSLSLPNQRTFYTIIYFEQYGGQFAIDRSMVRVQQGEVISIKSNSVSAFEIDKRAEGWMLLFNDAFFSKRYNDNVLHDFSCLKSNMVYKQLGLDGEIPRWRMMMEAMHDDATRLGLEARTILRSYLNIALGTLDRYGSVAIEGSYHREKENKIRTFEHLLEQHYRSERFPSFYADKLNISANYLNRICKERRRKSAGEVIRDRTLMEAERLLYHTFKTVSEISFELGFDSPSYFITFFKKKHGVSPEEFRRQQI